MFYFHIYFLASCVCVLLLWENKARKDNKKNFCGMVELFFTRTNLWHLTCCLSRRWEIILRNFGVFSICSKIFTTLSILNFKKLLLLINFIKVISSCHWKSYNFLGSFINFGLDELLILSQKLILFLGFNLGIPYS